MNVKHFLSLRFTSFVLIAFGAFLFYTGYQIGSIDDKNIKKREEQIYSFLLSAVIPVGLGFVSWTMNREIEEKSQESIVIIRNEVTKEKKRCQAVCHDISEELISILKPLQDTKVTYQKCIEEIEKHSDFIRIFQEKNDAAIKLTDWLKFSRNRDFLRKNIVSLAEEKHNIPPKYLHLYHKDIGRCINWLRDSIERLEGYVVDRNKLAYSLQYLPDGFDVYKTSLEGIKHQIDLIKLSGNSGVLEDFVDELIINLEK